MKQMLIKFVKVGLFVASVAVFLSLSSCEGPFILPADDVDALAIVPYDGDLEWTTVTANAGWAGRLDHAVVVHDEKLWVLGGYNPNARGDTSSYCDDVWRSVDGLNWVLTTDSAPWKGRRGHAVVSLNGYLMVFGGFTVDEATGARAYANDIWRSSDGVVWEPVITTGTIWRARMDHAVLVSGGKLYLLGGFYDGGFYLDDMWRSDDAGATWVEVSAGALPGARASFAATVDATGKLYLQGGSFKNAKPSSTGATDPSVVGWGRLWVYNPSAASPVWAVAPKPFLENGMSKRSEHALSLFDGDLLLLAGKANSSYRFSASTYTYATLIYEFGTGWRTDSLGFGPGPRYSYGTAVWTPPGETGERLWVLGGMSNDGALADVWQAQKRGVE
jgi:hypothetical protein